MVVGRVGVAKVGHAKGQPGVVGKVFEGKLVLKAHQAAYTPQAPQAPHTPRAGAACSAVSQPSCSRRRSRRTGSTRGWSIQLFKASKNLEAWKEAEAKREVFAFCLPCGRPPGFSTGKAIGQ